MAARTLRFNRMTQSVKRSAHTNVVLVCGPVCPDVSLFPCLKRGSVLQAKEHIPNFILLVILHHCIDDHPRGGGGAVLSVNGIFDDPYLYAQLGEYRLDTWSPRLQASEVFDEVEEGVFPQFSRRGSGAHDLRGRG